nr:periplasmic-binding protein [Acanthamoeba castellanii]
MYQPKAWSLALTLALFLFAAATSANKAKIVLTAEETEGALGFYSTDGELLGKAKVGLLPHEAIVSKDGTTAIVSNFGLHDFDSPYGDAGLYLSRINIPLRLEDKLFYTFPKGAPAHSAQRAPHGVKFNHDETKLYVNTEWTSSDGTAKPSILVYDLTDGSEEPAQVWTLGNNTNKCHNFVFSNDGRTVWLQLGPQGIAAMDAVTGEVKTPFLLGTTIVGVRGLTWSTVEPGVLIVSGIAELWAINTTAAYPPPVVRHYAGYGTRQFLYSAVSPDGKYIVAPAVWNSQVLIIDYWTTKVVARLSSDIDPVAIAISDDSRYAYATGGRGASLTKIDLRKFTTEVIPTGSATGPNGVTFAPKTNSYKTTEFTVGVVISLTGAGNANAYEFQSGLAIWKERINDTGGIALANNKAAFVRLVFLDDLSDSTSTSRLLRELVDEHGADALVVASAGFTPDRRLLRTLDQEDVPLLSLFQVEGDNRKRSDVRSELLRPRADSDVLGHDRWCSLTRYSADFAQRYSRNATTVNAQATAAGIIIEQAAVRSGRSSGKKLVEAIAATDTVLFSGAVKFDAQGNNIYGDSTPVLIRG